MATKELVLGKVVGKDAYEIALDNGFIGTEEEWLNSLKGDKGDTGEQGLQGSQGIQGVAGSAATISVGTVTTGVAGSSADVTNVGTTSAAKFNFTIPQGASGKEVEFNVSGTTLQWRYSGNSTWNNLFAIPQPSLVFSPHLWAVNTEIDLGDGSYGMKFAGTVTGAANAEISVNITPPFNMLNKYIIMYGGWWNSGSAGQNIAIPWDSTTGTPPIAARIHIGIGGDILYFRSTNSVARTNTPFQFWLRYIK